MNPPPKGAVVLVVAVAALYTLSLVVTNTGAGDDDWVGALVTERDMTAEDISVDCVSSPAIVVPAGESCRATVREKFRTVRRVALTLETGGSLVVSVEPSDDRELPASRAISTGEVTTDLNVSSRGADLVLACEGFEDCVVALP